MSVNIQALIEKNAERWRSMHLDHSRDADFQRIASKLVAPDAKARFSAVTKRLVTGGYQAVPWWAIAVIAYREYGGPPHWDRQLGQGDPLNHVSTHDPKGRGPFLDHPGDTIDNNAWLRGALDALIDCGPYAALWHDWSPGGAMTLLEEYNGLGYAAKGVPSAYVWSGTDQYTHGKYVEDHVYRDGVVDVQEGCAAILAHMMELDRNIAFKSTGPAIFPPPDHPANSGSLPSTAPGAPKRGLIQELLDAFRKL